ncbi:MAG: hypothetical protein R2867_38565 [Caldilineaceae bacterium]
MTVEAEQMLALGTKYEIALARQSGSVFSGWLLAKQGQLSAGIALICQGIDGFRRMGHAMYQTHRLAMLVEMLLWTAEYKKADKYYKKHLIFLNAVASASGTSNSIDFKAISYWPKVNPTNGLKQPTCVRSKLPNNRAPNR